MKLFDKIKNNVNLFRLFQGNLVSQLVILISVPIISRIYSPDIFSIFSSFMLFVNILSIINTGKFDTVIFIEDEKNLNKVLYLIFCSMILFSGIMLLLLFGNSYFTWDLFKYLGPLKDVNIFYIYLASILFSINIIILEVVLKLRKVKSYTTAKILNVVIVSLVTVLFGMFDKQNGLILGYLIGNILYFFTQIRHFSNFRFAVNTSVLNEAKIYFRQHIKCVTHYMPSQLVNVAVGLIPAYFISFHYGLSELGLFLMSERFASLFLNVVGNSFREDFRTKLLDVKKSISVYELQILAIKRILPIALISTFGFLVISFGFIEFFLGQKWLNIGYVFRILLVSLTIQFVNMPTSYLFVFLKRQDLDFLWQLFYFSLVFFAFYIFSGKVEFYSMVMIFSFARLIAYLTQLLLSLRIAKVVDNLHY